MTSAVNCQVRCLCAGLLIAICAFTSPAASTNSTWSARPWVADDGLPNNTVTAVAQTSDGYIWVATPVGLARFDGVRFEEFSHTNYVAEPNRGVLTLRAESSGRFCGWRWIAAPLSD